MPRDVPRWEIVAQREDYQPGPTGMATAALVASPPPPRSRTDAIHLGLQIPSVRPAPTAFISASY